MIVCPGCKAVAEVGTYPYISMATDEMTDEAVDWWCRACLAARVSAAHAGDCACIGCRR